MGRKPSDLPRVTFRFPEDLRGRLESAAKSNNRSVNAEIIARLEESFEQHIINDDLDSRVDGLEERVWDILYTLGDGLKRRPVE